MDDETGSSAAQHVQTDPASRRLRGLAAPPAGDVALVVRIHAELVGSRTDDLVVDRADGCPVSGFTVVKALTIATRVPLPSCSVSPMRACVSRSGRGLAAGFRAHGADTSTSAAEGAASR